MQCERQPDSCVAFRVTSAMNFVVPHEIGSGIRMSKKKMKMTRR